MSITALGKLGAAPVRNLANSRGAPTNPTPNPANNAAVIQSRMTANLNAFLHEEPAGGWH
jgi:hypothetical protein